MIKYLIIFISLVVVLLASCILFPSKPRPKEIFTGDLLAVAKAIKAKKIDKAKALAEKLPNIDATGKYNVTLLGFAVADQNIPAINMLMELGANPGFEMDEPISNSTITPGRMAQLQANTDALKALLDAGMNPDLPFKRDGTLLHDVPKIRQSDALKLLVEYGANVNAKDRLGETPLFKMVNVSFDEALYLLDHGADPFVMNINGNTLAYSVQTSLESMNKESEAYQKMQRIQAKMIALGVQFPALSPFGERTRRKMVYCKEPSGWQLPANCKVKGELEFWETEPSEELRLRDEKILRERYGINAKVQLKAWLWE